jgi:hypothetical protein
MAVSGSRCCAGDFGGEVRPGHVYRVEHVQVVEEVCRRDPPAGAKGIVKQDSLQGGRESQNYWVPPVFSTSTVRPEKKGVRQHEY